MTYDMSQGDKKFVAFDILNVYTGGWLNYQDMINICRRIDIPTAPQLYIGNMLENDALFALAEG